MPNFRYAKYGSDTQTSAIDDPNKLWDETNLEIQEIKNSLAKTWVVKASPGVDCAPEVIQGLADLKANGGGILYFPRIGGYVTKSRFLIDFSNITVVLEDDIRYTETSRIDAIFHFRGSISPVAYLDNVALIAPKRVTIDANGRNLVGYVQPAPGSPSGFMFGVYFQYCRNVTIQNIYAYNGIAGGIILQYCLGGKMINCEASDVLYDNGIYIYNNGEHYGLPTEANPASWANIEVINPKAWNCANHGLGIYGAIGTTWINPKIWNCGNNTPTGPDGFARAAGPAGGFGVEFDSNTDPGALLNYRCTVFGLQVTGSFGFGFRTNCIGTKIIGGFIRAPKKPTAYTDSVPAIWGTCAFVQNAGTLVIENVDMENSEQFGVRIQGTGTQQPKCRIEGCSITGCVDRALYAINFAEVYTSPNTIMSNNGTLAGGVRAIELNNVPNFAGSGLARISGQIDGNGGPVMSAAQVGTLHLLNIRGHNNGALLAATDHAIFIDGALTNLYASDILLSSTNARQARIIRTNVTIAKAVIARESILGDQTSTTAPRADVAATTLIADVFSAVAPAAAPLYFGQKWYDTALSKMYFAKGQAGVGDWIILN